MLGVRRPSRRSGKDEAEKPFWISFSDLMSALMVLFLVAMAVALITVTKTLKQLKDKQQAQDQLDRDHDGMIRACMADVAPLTKRPEFSGVTVNKDEHLIDFGTLVLFGNNQHTFEKAEQEHFVRTFVPKVLEVARTANCEKWLKEIDVVGFASQTGDYLYNLNLSYLRSQRVLCVLLASKQEDALDPKDRALIQTLFLVGGSSFNTARGEESSMRRVELKLIFRERKSPKQIPAAIPLDPGLKCPNESR